MGDLFSRTLAKLYEPAYISQGVDFTGIDINTFQKKTGSRMQLAVSVHSIDGGATLNVTLENAATLVDPVYSTALNQNYTVAGIDTKILLDLNRYCQLTVTVTGGQATYSVVVTLVDNASSGDYATNTKLDELITAVESGSSLNIGTEDGTLTGTQHVFVNNTFEQIKVTHDRSQSVSYADFGTNQERITQIDYTSPTFPGVTAREVFSYTLVGGKYRLDTVVRSLV
jgi:hypothetical protein